MKNNTMERRWKRLWHHCHQRAKAMSTEPFSLPKTSDCESVIVTIDELAGWRRAEAKGKVLYERGCNMWVSFFDFVDLKLLS